MSLITDIQLQVDETGGPVFWVIEQLYDAANAAQLEVWANLKDWQQTSTPITLASGNDIVALPNTIIMIPQFIVYSGVKIFPTTHALLQDWSNNWKNETPTRPNWIVLWDESHIRVWPRANAAYTLTLYGVPWPTEITDGVHDIANVDVLVRRAIVLRAAAKLLETTQPELADAKAVEALEFEKRYARQQRNVFGDNISRLRPKTAWDLANNGDIKTGRLFMGNQD